MTKENEILKNFTILYVEDDIQTLKVISEILSVYFKEVYTALDGNEGLLLYKEKNPDLVLSDISMPKMNGIEMSKNIKSIDNEQIIVFLTAFNELDYLKEAIEIGVSSYITKPIKKNQFFKSLVSMAKILQSDIDKNKLAHMLNVQSKVASMGEMLGNISHQWRQPLSVITMASSSLKLDVELFNEVSNEKLISHVDKINEQANYLSKTIDDFRNYFYSDTNRKEKHEINDIFQKLDNLIVFSQKSNYIKNIVNIEKDLYVFVNESLMVQALINIFNNSKDALKEFVSDSELRFTFLDIVKEGNDIIIKIKDSAGGIKSSVISKVFDPYFTTKDKSIGTGIGLYMTYEIITRHFNGTIDVQNVEYTFEDKHLKGAEFTITLPLS